MLTIQFHVQKPSQGPSPCRCDTLVGSQLWSNCWPTLRSNQPASVSSWSFRRRREIVTKEIQKEMSQKGMRREDEGRDAWLPWKGSRKGGGRPAEVLILHIVRSFLNCWWLLVFLVGTIVFIPHQKAHSVKFNYWLTIEMGLGFSEQEYSMNPNCSYSWGHYYPWVMIKTNVSIFKNFQLEFLGKKS